MSEIKSAVRIAVEPLINDAAEKAKEKALQRVEWLKKELEKHNWNIKNAFPFPSSTLHPNVYKIGRSNYNFAHRLTDTNKEIHKYGPYGYNPDRFVVIREDRVQEYIEKQIEFAKFQYEEFIKKLEYKIGPHISAILEGNHVWDKSYLTVTKLDGEGELPGTITEIWKTQQIDNRSKFGEWFPQWPSRKVKRK